MLCGIGLNVIFSLIAYGLDFDDITAKYVFPSVTATLFFVFFILSLAFAGLFAAKSKHLYITRIRKKSSFLKLSSWLAASILLLLFLHETARLLAIGHVQNPAIFDGWRIARYVLTIPFSAYFVVMVFPTKIKKTRIKIPNGIKYFLSLCAIAWCIVSALTFYFSQDLSMTNSFMHWEIIYSLICAMFFIFEAKFEYLKPNNALYVFFTLATCIIGFTFSVSGILGLSMGFFESNVGLSETQHITNFGLALYALARIYAIPNTMKYVMDNDDTGSFSSKFNKLPDDFADDDE